MAFRYFFVLLSIVVSTSVMALPILERVLDNGQLIGARNVAVGNSFFDVSFVEGTCANLFDGCDESPDFIFDTQTLSLVASQALIDQVFLDMVFFNFGSDPKLTCGSSLVGDFCAIVTPHERQPPFPQSYNGGIAEIRVGGNRIYETNGGRFFDTSTYPQFIYAQWSKSTKVPEPETITLLSIGLLVFYWFRLFSTPNYLKA